jgi:hypothetical protein
MADDLRGGAGRKDEVGRSGIYPATGPYPEGDVPVITPGEINKSPEPTGPGVLQNDELKNVERLPRFGDEEDLPDNDALGG